MAEREDLTTISFISDDSTGIYEVGEIDGLLQQHQLKEYLRQHGKWGRTQLIEHLAYLQHQVIVAWKESQLMDTPCCAAKESNISEQKLYTDSTGESEDGC